MNDYEKKYIYFSQEWEDEKILIILIISTSLLNLFKIIHNEI